MISQHALQVSRPTPSGGSLRGLAGGGVSRPTPRGEVEGSGLEGSPGPHPEGRLRGLTGGGLQAHTQGVTRATAGGVSRPTLGVGGCIPACTEADPPPHTHTADGYCCGRYASYWNAFLLLGVSMVYRVRMYPYRSLDTDPFM